MAKDLTMPTWSPKTLADLRKRCQQLEAELDRLTAREDSHACRAPALVVWRKLLREYALLELTEARAIVRKKEPVPGKLLKWAVVCGLQGAALFAGIAVETQSTEVRQAALRSIEIVLEKESREVLVEACLDRAWGSELASVSFHHETLGWMELDLPLRALPSEIQVGDRFPLTLFCDQYGRIRNWEPEIVARPERGRDAEPHPLRPHEPADWDDPAEVARYREELKRLFEPNHGQ